jgi:hypothetical protein
MEKRVMEIAGEWLEGTGLRFEVVRSGPANIRIGFLPDDGSWSYLGTDALSIGSDEVTLNLGWITATTPRKEMRRVVLHEFGHALGLEAANTSPIARIPWRKARTYAFFAGAPNHWSRQDVEDQVFRKYTEREAIHSQGDPYSIMYHPAPAECTEPGFSWHEGSDLSEGDKAFIRQLYPPLREAPPAAAVRPGVTRRSAAGKDRSVKATPTRATPKKKATRKSSSMRRAKKRRMK